MVAERDENREVILILKLNTALPKMIIFGKVFF